jgi:hypothetical protein
MLNVQIVNPIAASGVPGFGGARPIHSRDGKSMAARLLVLLLERGGMLTLSLWNALGSAHEHVASEQAPWRFRPSSESRRRVGGQIIFFADSIHEHGITAARRTNLLAHKGDAVLART